jgi:hypothetical protein
MSPKSSISSPMSPGLSPRALAAAHARTPPEQASGIREEDEGGGGQGGLRLVRRRRRAAAAAVVRGREARVINQCAESTQLRTLLL